LEREPEQKMSTLQDRPTTLDIGRVLRFWHKVGFFIPFDLQKQVLEARDADWAVRTWSSQSLPHGAAYLWSFKLPPGRKLVGFDIFLGVFDKSVLTGVVRDALSEQEELDQDERGELEGLTCMAKVKAGPSGEPLLQEVSVSTAPWALGRVQAKGLAGLEFHVFEDSIEALKFELLHFRTARTMEAGVQLACGGSEAQGSAVGASPVPLSGDELKALLALFQRWSGYGPEAPGADQPVLVIRAKSIEDRKKRGAVATCCNQVQADEDDEDEADEAELEIDILNSFFAKDIARAIRSLERQEDCPAVAPYQVSVQNLADGANFLGANVPVGGQTQWIGSPLRVHRRCVDPMFTIANAIAYQNKMIFFDPDRPESRLPPADTLDIGPSAWVCLGGVALNKHVVREQVELVVEAVQILYRRTRMLPDLYVISPFRQIKQALIDRISDLKQWPSDSQPNGGDLRGWCTARIGTVHTFQGKEESVVLMVLGCDRRTAGAAQWAASKPNLLNVALTRPKHRFFIIGDEDLWSGLPHFCDAGNELLPRITAATFLERARGKPCRHHPGDEGPYSKRLSTAAPARGDGRRMIVLARVQLPRPVHHCRDNGPNPRRPGPHIHRSSPWALAPATHRRIIIRGRYADRRRIGWLLLTFHPGTNPQQMRSS
jgi:AAA domain